VRRCAASKLEICMRTKPQFGILGPGSIAVEFADGVGCPGRAGGGRGGSRSPENARRFADRFNIERCHTGYEALVADPEIDAVYVATPHTFHCEHTLLRCATANMFWSETLANPCGRSTENGGRGPTAPALPDGSNVVSLPLHPGRDPQLRLPPGRSASCRCVQADFGFRASFNPASRLFDPALGGGALLDVGIYPISLAMLLLGQPDRIAALAALGSSGVDENTGILLGFPGGELALLSTTVRATTLQEAILPGRSRVNPAAQPVVGWQYPHPAAGQQRP
jgi:hypothetical protein